MECDEKIQQILKITKHVPGIFEETESEVPVHAMTS